MNLMRRVIRNAVYNPMVDYPLQSLMRHIVRSPRGRARLNALYERMSAWQRYRFRRRYGEIFIDHPPPDTPGVWRLPFNGRTIDLPLEPDAMWHHWNAAVSVLVNDYEVKQTYGFILNSAEKPDLFLDVGANYGTHSALMLAFGVQAISFEPNPHCEPYFRKLCSLNGLEGRLEKVAAGPARQDVELVFPQRETWLGSAAPEVAEALKLREDCETVTVPMRPLDDYYDAIQPYEKLLIKIDVEGFEEQVLEGARAIIAAKRPKIIFESIAGVDRGGMHSLLSELGYRIAALPYSPNEPAPTLEKAEFRSARATNFIALPEVRS